MSIASSIDKILTSGIDLERVRLHKELFTHLKSAHGWSVEDINNTLDSLDLNRSASVDTHIDKQCGVCGSSKPSTDTGEPTQTFYGQTLHPCCVEELTKVLDLFIPKEG